MRFSLLLFALFVFTSCGQNIAKNETNTFFASFYLRYVKDNNSLKAEAAFFEEGTDNKKSPKLVNSPVLFDGNPMKTTNYNGETKYVYNTRGPQTDTYRFFCKEIQLNYSVNLDGLPNWKIEENPSISKALNLNWEGKPLSKTESISFLFVHEKGEAYTINYLGPTQTTKVRLRPEQLNVLTPGQHEISLIRRNNRSLSTEENIKGEQLIEYYTKTSILNLVP